MSFFYKLGKNPQDHIRNWRKNADIQDAKLSNLNWVKTNVKKIDSYIAKKENNSTKSSYYNT